MYVYKRMNQEDAEEISFSWNYPGIFKFYNMDYDIDNLAEILDSKTRYEYNYYSVYKNNNLFGYINFGISDDYKLTEIGLAINPQFINQGFGSFFVKSAINFIIDKYTNINKVLLYVVNFNSPAIKIYKELGFIIIDSLYIYINNKKFLFYKMILKFNNIT